MFVRPSSCSSTATAKLLAGGQSLLPIVNAGLLECQTGISPIDGLSDITGVGDAGFVDVGALAPHALPWSL